MGPGGLVGQALGSYLSGVFPSIWGHHSLVLWDSCQAPPPLQLGMSVLGCQQQSLCPPHIPLTATWELAVIETER